MARQLQEIGQMQQRQAEKGRTLGVNFLPGNPYEILEITSIFFGALKNSPGFLGNQQIASFWGYPLVEFPGCNYSGVRLGGSDRNQIVIVSSFISPT